QCIRKLQQFTNIPGGPKVAHQRKNRIFPLIVNPRKLIFLGCFSSRDIIEFTECLEQTQLSNYFLFKKITKYNKKNVLNNILFNYNVNTFDELLFYEHLKIKCPNPICDFCGEKFNSTIGNDQHRQKCLYFVY
ncbi:unnamed protein product, partial [Rotaria magnacalcarata]